ncbi:hypothetical protein [Streptomyces sp. NBC_01276]|uniref:hypothetical protein n=1 Tax=Streptomyces sp. NBC_01276 TaxID=2903808 RepID=UPI00352C33F3
MGRYEITAPHEGDEHVAGVTFTAGRATATDPNEGALLYFRRHGYSLEPLGDEQTSEPDGPQDTKPAGRSAARSKRG